MHEHTNRHSACRATSTSWKTMVEGKLRRSPTVAVSFPHILPSLPHVSPADLLPSIFPLSSLPPHSSLHLPALMPPLYSSLSSPFLTWKSIFVSVVSRVNRKVCFPSFISHPLTPSVICRCTSLVTAGCTTVPPEIEVKHLPCPSPKSLPFIDPSVLVPLRHAKP